MWPKAIPLLILAGLLAYSNSFTKVFVLDDVAWITHNSDLPQGWRYVGVSGRPLVDFTILVNYRLGGLNPMGYHAFNLAVHILAGLTLYGLVRRVLLLPRFAGRYDASAPAIAFAAALLWLIHPLQTQAVTYIIQRAESMMGLFYLFAFYSWVRGATGSKWWYAAAVASFTLSINCKEVAATLPPLLIIFDRVFLARSWRELAAKRWMYCLALVIIWGVELRPLLQTALGGAPGSDIGFSMPLATPYQYLLTESEVILHYLGLAFFPVGQTMDYLDWPIAKSLAQVWPAFLAVSALLLGSIVLLFIRPAAGFIGFWFFAILAPTSSIMPIVDPAFEHRMYLSLATVTVSVSLAIACLLRTLPVPRPAAVAIASVLLAAAALPLIGLTFQRNETYRSLTASYEDNIRKRPNNPRPYSSLCVQLAGEGNLEGAFDALSRGMQSTHWYVPALRRPRASLLAASGQDDEAEKVYRELVGLPFAWPASNFDYRNLANLLIGRGKPQDAVTVIKELISHDPQTAQNYMILAAAELATGDEPAANAAVAEAVRLNPNIAATTGATVRNLVFAKETPNVALLRRQGLWTAAAACLADGGRDPELLDTLAMAYAWNGQFPQAADAARRGVAAAAACGDRDWEFALQKRVKLYEAGKPYTKDS
jgi:tetratricopeptide (TPR) repeat protein